MVIEHFLNSSDSGLENAYRCTCTRLAILTLGYLRSSYLRPELCKKTRECNFNAIPSIFIQQWNYFKEMKQCK